MNMSSYRTVQQADRFAWGRRPPKKHCSIGCQINAAFLLLMSISPHLPPRCFTRSLWFWWHCTERDMVSVSTVTGIHGDIHQSVCVSISIGMRIWGCLSASFAPHSYHVCHRWCLSVYVLVMVSLRVWDAAFRPGPKCVCVCVWNKLWNTFYPSLICRGNYTPVVGLPVCLRVT